MAKEKERPMFESKVIKTCADCGEVFEIKQMCYTQEKANNSAAWAAKYVHTCPKCDFFNMRTETGKGFKFEWYSMPKIQYGSKEKIEQAEKERNDFIYENKDYLRSTSMEKFRNMMLRLINDGFTEDFTLDDARTLPCLTLTLAFVSKFTNDHYKFLSLFFDDADMVLDCLHDKKVNCKSILENFKCEVPSYKAIFGEYS